MRHSALRGEKAKKNIILKMDSHPVETFSFEKFVKTKGFVHDDLDQSDNKLCVCVLRFEELHQSGANLLPSITECGPSTAPGIDAKDKNIALLSVVRKKRRRKQSPKGKKKRKI